MLQLHVGNLVGGACGSIGIRIEHRIAHRVPLAQQLEGAMAFDPLQVSGVGAAFLD